VERQILINSNSSITWQLPAVLKNRWGGWLPPICDG
jgi:hypothetical protein